MDSIQRYRHQADDVPFAPLPKACFYGLSSISVSHVSFIFSAYPGLNSVFNFVSLVLGFQQISPAAAFSQFRGYSEAVAFSACFVSASFLPFFFHFPFKGGLYPPRFVKAEDPPPLLLTIANLKARSSVLFSPQFFFCFPIFLRNKDFLQLFRLSIRMTPSLPT